MGKNKVNNKIKAVYVISCYVLLSLYLQDW